MEEPAGEWHGDAEQEARAAQVAAARARFGALVRRPDREINVAEAALLIAAEEYPGLDVGAYLSKLEALAARVRARMAAGTGGSAADPDEVALQALHTVLFQEEGFRGSDPEHYYSARNSMLNEVIDRRRGLPITLSIVYCEVARRAGLEAAGIGLPYHFIAQFRGQHLSVYVDPFNGGKRLSIEECAAVASRARGAPVELAPEHLQPASNKQILARLLGNLKGVYLQRGQLMKALAATERILVVSPAIEQVRDRGLILRALGDQLLQAAARAVQQAEAAGDPEAPSPAPEQMQLLLQAQQANHQSVTLLAPAWFDLKLYARLAEGASDAAEAAEAAESLWRRMARHN